MFHFFEALLGPSLPIVMISYREEKSTGVAGVAENPDATRLISTRIHCNNTPNDITARVVPTSRSERLKSAMAGTTSKSKSQKERPPSKVAFRFDVLDQPALFLEQPVLVKHLLGFLGFLIIALLVIQLMQDAMIWNYTRERGFHKMQLQERLWNHPSQGATTMLRNVSTSTTVVAVENNGTLTAHSASSRDDDDQVHGITPFNMSQYKAIYFHHTRKAGGTSIRNFLQNVCHKYGLQFVVKEGWVFEPQHALAGSYNHNTTLFVTNLRQPIHRIESSYYFEGIWPQKEMHRTNETMRTTLEWDFIVNNATLTPITWHRPANNFLWECTSECYCKWFGGWDNTNKTLNCSRAHFNLKDHFDVVMVMEQLHDQEYLDNLSKLFQAEDIPLLHMNLGRIKKNTTAGSNSSNDTTAPKAPRPRFSQEERDFFVQKNQEDLQLYEYFYNQSLLLHVWWCWMHNL